MKSSQARMKLNPPLLTRRSRISSRSDFIHRRRIYSAKADFVEKSTLSRAFFWRRQRDSNPRSVTLQISSVIYLLSTRTLSTGYPQVTPTTTTTFLPIIFFTSHKSFIKFMIFIATSKNAVRDTSVEFVSMPENTKKRIRSKLICGFV